MSANNGYYGEYGGCFVPETLVTPLKELEQAYLHFIEDHNFQQELSRYLANFVGRPTPLYYAERITKKLGGAKIFFKREDLCHTGAHKINNAVAQVLLASKMGKNKIIAETGAGQHGVATASAAALFGMKCTIFMGEVDAKRQALNVARMKLMGAEVIRVKYGSQTLKDATAEAMRYWVTNIKDSYYVLGSALGPHPYPMIVKNFQKIIGIEARKQIIDICGKLPDLLIACVGGGSNALGLFHAFLPDESVAMIGVEAGGLGLASTKHAARFAEDNIGVMQGTKTYLLQDENGQVRETHSISAGLDYPAVGPEHSYLHDIKRVSYTYIRDEEAILACKFICENEGILPALESSHALAHLIKVAGSMKADQIIIVGLSGRGDKDVETLKGTI
jgi:tryptophan synthase beta chain